MNKSYSNNKSSQKRKAKNRHKEKKWKRTKLEAPRLFQEASFDSSDEDKPPTNQVSSHSLPQYFKQSLILTPSKSEYENNSPVRPHFEVCDDENAISCPITEDRFDDDDRETSFTYGSILEEFVDEDGDDYAEVVSVPVHGVGAKCVELEGARKKEKKRKNKKLEYVEINGTEELNISSEKKKIKAKIPASLPVQKELQNGDSGCANLLDKEAQYYNVNDGILMLIEHKDTIYFYGVCLLTVLHGQVEILGHTLTKNSPQAQLYSPRGSSLLYLRNITESEVPVTNYLLSLKHKNRIKLTQKCAIVFCTKLQSHSLHFVEKHISQQILPTEQHNFPRVVFQPKEGSWNVLKTDEKWNEIVDKIGEKTKLMICGGKGVGKTTLLRYAVNRLLMRFSTVQIIDLDPGQSEFTVPGCISIVKVCKPVFGVNYTHLQGVERSILSNINIAYEPDKYISSVRELINVDLDEIPTLINYMGYTHGMGLNILSAVITCIKPSDILQICSRDAKKNYKFILENDVVAENAKLFMSVDSDLSYNLNTIGSMADENDSWTAESRQLREMCVLSYISDMVECNSIFKNKAPMYKISLNDIKISSLNGEEINPAAVNGCLVALCTLENEEERIFRCFSWGIVRGFDSVTDELVLVTNENLKVLDGITHLVSNGVTLPPSVYMTADEVTGRMPYVMEGLLMSFGQIPKRSRISAKSAK